MAVRRAIGMVFQKPNPFPTMSIFDNVAAGPAPDRAAAAATCDGKVEAALRGAGLWEEVNDRLGEPGAGLSGGQQQRLCIARSLAVDPEVILMDEPCSALDPIATLKIEELIDELKQRVTIVIVTHNMQQAARVADRTAFMLDGELVEVGPTQEIFTKPSRPADRGICHRQVRLAAASRPGCGAAPRPSAAGRERRGHHGPRALPGAAARARTHALGGLDLIVEQLDRVLEALEHQDVELAQMVIADDDRVDGRYLEVHQGILSLLALQAPVAGDLRLVAALLHLIKHIERMGDQCVNIAKLIPLSGHEPPVRREVLERAREDGRLRALGGRPGEGRLRRPRRRPGRGPRAPGPRDQPPEPRDLPPGDRDRRRPRHARVGDAHDRSSPARWSASATTPSTSASRSRSSSPACSGSSRTPRARGVAAAR